MPQRDVRRHFIAFGGELASPGMMTAETVRLDVDTEFRGLPNPLNIKTVKVPASWWLTGYVASRYRGYPQGRSPTWPVYPTMRAQVLDQAKQELAKAATAKKAFEVYVAGVSRGSGMATYAALDLLSESKKDPTQAQLAATGVYLFAAEKPGDKELIRLYASNDGYKADGPHLQGPNLDVMRTHIWGNLEDVMTVYPPRTVEECQAAKIALGNKPEYICDRDLASDGVPTALGFHSLPPSYWWHLTSGEAVEYTVPTWQTWPRPPVYCVSGHQLAIRRNDATGVTAANDGFAKTLEDSEHQYK